MGIFKLNEKNQSIEPAIHRRLRVQQEHASLSSIKKTHNISLQLPTFWQDFAKEVTCRELWIISLTLAPWSPHCWHCLLNLSLLLLSIYLPTPSSTPWFHCLVVQYLTSMPFIGIYLASTTMKSTSRLIHWRLA